MASEIAQYLDDDGTPITASSDVKLPKGYALLSSKKKDTPKKNVKELKVQAEVMKPAPIDYTSNPKNEGLYSMYGRTGTGDAVGELKVPYSKVQDALKSGSTFYNGSGEVYDKDKAAESKPVSWYQNIIQSPALVSTPNEKQQAGSFSNLDKAAARTVLATPAYVKQLWDAAQSMHRGEVSGGDEFANLINPAQLPKQLYDQYQVDAKVDKKMAADNLLGSLAGLGVVGAVTHGAAKAVGAIPEHVQAIRDKFTPVTETPARTRTNVLHRNTAGEVRQANGQAPSVWLSPKAWESFMGSLYPGEDAAATHGVNLPSADLHAFANDAQLSAADPHFGEVQQLLAKAHENASGGGVAIAKQRPSIQSNVNVMREELNHTWQRGLSETGNFSNHLKPEAFTDLHQSIPKGMNEHLLDQGYDGTSAPEMVTEAAVKLMDGRPERFGVSPDEAVDFLDKYFKHVSDQHGTGALEELHHVRGIAADAKTRAIGEHSGTGAGQDNGTVPSVGTGGQGGDAQGLPAAGDPLFNRDKEKPTWYLKSERLIGDKMKGPQAAEDVNKMLISGGVKPEEMQWTGLDDFLKSKGKNKVTPEEIKQHLAENNIQVKDVTKGDGLTPSEKARHQELLSKVFRGMSQDESNELNSLSQKNSSYSEPKYGSYQLPGGENYREMLLTMPSKDAPSGKSWTSVPGGTSQDFRSGHWDEPNILAHVRFNDRTGPNGEKLLHVEEVQSDWHQHGRDKGYIDAESEARKSELRKEADRLQRQKSEPITDEELAKYFTPGKVIRGYGGYDKVVAFHPADPNAAYPYNTWSVDVQRVDKDGNPMRFEGVRNHRTTPETENLRPELYQRIRDIADELRPSQGKVPDAPFKKTWHEMALRRILKHASDSGYDGVSWTPGAEQAARYDLSKKIKSISYNPVDKKLEAEQIGGGLVKESVEPDKLGNMIGKEAARKLLETEQDGHGWHTLEGENLSIGGEGMRGFYDKIVPDYLNKFGKKFGAKVGDTKIRTSGDSYDYHFEDGDYVVQNHDTGGKSWAFGTAKEAAAFADEMNAKGITVQHLPITPEMRKSVTEEGMPLFNKERREDLATRKRVEEMTPEEMKKALLTSDVTGAPNRRAFDDAEHVSPSPAIGMSDADGLKALNDRFGYAAGNELLKAKADALKAAGLDAYHEKGDEFLYRGESPESLKEKLDKAREILRDRKIEVTLKNGKKRYFKGADFSYGTGKDLDESESGLKQHKQTREDRGERKRGELVGITEVESGGSDEHPSDAELENLSAKQEESPTTLDLNTNEKGDGGELPEQPKGEDVSPPAVSSFVPVQGGTQLFSAPIQVPVVPVVRMQVLPMAQVRAMAAARNPQRQTKNVREVMEEAKARMGNSIVP